MGRVTGTIEEKAITPSYRKKGVYILTFVVGIYLWGILSNATYHTFRYVESLIESKRVQVYAPKEREWWQTNSEKALNELANPRILVPLSFIKNYNMDTLDITHKKKYESNRR